VFKLPPLPRTISACEADLRSEDVRVRKAVVVDLGRLRDEGERPRRTELLLLALGDSNSDVRRQALLSLADIEAEGITSAIVPLLSDVEIRVRQIAVLALGELGSAEDREIVGRLASLLRAGDASIRYQALSAYTTLVPAEAEADVVRGLADEDAEIREIAVRLIDEVYLERQLEIGVFRDALAQACTDPSFHVRLVAQVLSADQGWPSPHDALIDLVERRARAREPRDEQSAIALCGTLRLERAAAGLSRRAFGILGLSFDPFRWAAVTSLAKLGNERALSRLRAGLRSRNFADRTLAAQGLGEAAVVDALPALQALVGREARIDQEILAEALQKLGA